MKRKIISLIAAFSVVCFFAPGVSGEEYSSLVMDKLSSYLDDDVAEKVENVNTTEGTLSDIWQIVLQTVTDNAETLAAPVRCLALFTAGSVLVSVFSAYDSNNGFLQFGVIAAAALCAVQGLSGLIDTLAAVCRGVSVFLMGAVPVYAGLMISSGNPAAGTSYGTVTLILANIISAAASSFIIPALAVLLGLSVAGTFSSYKITGIIEGIYKPVRWVLTFAVSAFSGLISLQTFVSSKISAAGVKTAKQLVSSAIPVVGSALGDGVEAVRQSMVLLRTGAGAFGLIAELIIFTPVFISGILWFLCFSVSSVICELFGAGKLKCFTDSCLLIVKVILAAAVSVFVVSVVTAAVVVCAGE